MSRRMFSETGRGHIIGILNTMTMENKQFEPKSMQEGILNNVQDQVLLAKKLQSVYDNRPNLDSFIDIPVEEKFRSRYTKEQIEKDKAYVDDLRKKIDERNHSFSAENLDVVEGGFQLSEMLQAMVVDRMNKHWYKDCSTIMTADFDDLAVGIDAVMKGRNGDYLGTSFDFTVSTRQKILEDKLKNHWEKSVIEGRIPTVKYFEDPDTHKKGSLVVPKFIIGASKKDVEELASAYLTNDMNTLENHPFKYVLLLQIEEQLQTALDYYATQGNNPSIQFAKTNYERIQNLLRIMKNQIHLDENIQNQDLYEYSKNNVALETMRRFRITKGNKPD